jgi:hypothetical protein
MTADEAERVATWRYRGDWSIYDLESVILRTTVLRRDVAGNLRTAAERVRAVKGFGGAFTDRG